MINKKKWKPIEEEPKVCPKCNGRGYICKKFGETTTCYDCLRKGRLG